MFILGEQVLIEDQRMERAFQMISGSQNRVSPLLDLYRQCVNCTACPARQECKAPVTGVGNTDAHIMIVGRNPGKNEDDRGIPFCGQGGELLTTWLGWAELQTIPIYITNMMKCFTKENREPKSLEILTCGELWLQKEMRMLAPTLILVFGEQACIYLTGMQLKFARKKIVTREFNGRIIHIIASIHPGAPLRNGRYMKEFKDDAFFVKAMIKNAPELLMLRELITVVSPGWKV